eukprot:CAMPEP_0119285280 /NCGR_PEP_ID=MMETSP1329-20130426/31894_1 /TAXON_ID=114041 /ORGANISM="Genus nov. species nov., Strain RCC1024" /LENGTH=287 /DNA_ID=CAMNT_0007285987 /DNA_START=116 /DNA_END=975 /DNA_ORIENTATION=-
MLLLLARRALPLRRPTALRAQSTDVEAAFRRALRDDCGVRPGDAVVASVSGGCDSTALLHLLARSDVRLSVVTFDHRQRGAASAGDAAFVEALARRYGLPCRTETWTGGKGSQAAFRDWRRAVLADRAREEGAHVALGHHADDDAETFLLRLARGARLSKLAAGVAPRQGPFVRPLLQLAKADLVAYLEAAGEGWREDASNREDVYLRNRARLSVAPPLADLCGGEARLRARLASLRAQSRDLAAWVGGEADAFLARGGAGVGVEGYAALPKPVRLEVLDRLASEAS